jgi:membrane-associated phospholipid phosphatase
MHKQFSFPSGHSTTVFAIATLLSLFYKSPRISVFLVIISSLTAFSRVYLSQHFIQDVLAGSFFGIVSSLLVYYYLEKMNVNQLNNSSK